MNKALIAGAVSLGIGLVGANHLIVDYAKQELPIQTAKIFKAPATSPFSIKRLDVVSEGNQVIERYEVTVQDEVLTAGEAFTLIYTHTANIGLFALNIEGKTEAQKDQEAMSKIREILPEFSESMTYQFNTLSKSAEFIGQITLNKLASNTDATSVDLGKLTYSGTLTPDELSVHLKSSPIKVVHPMGNLDTAGIELSLTQGKTAKKDSGTWVMRDIVAQTAFMPDETYSAKLVTVDMSADTTDIASAVVNYDIDELHWPTMDAQGQVTTLDTDIDLKVVIDNLNYKAIKAVESLPSDITAEQKQEAMDTALRGLFSHGFDISTMSLKMKGTTMDGTFKLKAADYGNATQEEVTMMLVPNIEVNMDLAIDKEMATYFVPNPAMLDSTFTLEGDTYKSNFKFVNGRPVVNGQQM